MGSTMVARRAGDPPAASLSLLAGVALHDAVTHFTGAAPGLTLKWPNDLLWHKAKLAGVLLEGQGDVIVIGIGVNLSFAPQLAGRDAVALSAFGHDVPRDDFAQILAGKFANALAGWRGGQWPDGILSRWLHRAHPIGTSIFIRAPLDDAPQAGLTGRFDGLEQDGALRIRLDDGQLRIIHAGEVGVTP